MKKIKYFKTIIVLNCNEFTTLKKQLIKFKNNNFLHYQNM